MDILQIFEKLGSTGVIIVMAWYLVRNLVTTQASLQKAILEVLVRHDADNKTNWLTSAERIAAQHEALLVQHRAILAHGDANIEAMRGLSNQINGMKQE